MIYKYKILTFLACIFFLINQLCDIDQIFKNKRLNIVKEKYLESCLNQVKFENEMSVWTLLTDNSNYLQ